jgi:hypothetical protein
MELMEYWGDYPPPHLLLRAYMGIGKEKAKPGKELDQCTDNEFSDFLGMVNG